MTQIPSTPIDIVILGAGYGGISCIARAARLFRRHANVRLHLVDRQPYHLLETRLHERAVRAAEVTVPITRILARRPNVTFHLGEVTRIDLEGRRVELDFGGGNGAPRAGRSLAGRSLAWDHLVIAIGSKTNFYQIPGLEQHAFQLKELADSERIREHTERMFARASSEPDAARRRDLLRVVIGGGGLTGVELATEMAERFDALARAYRIDPAEPELLLIEAGDRVLPTLDGRQAATSIEAMQAIGVQILTKTRVVGMEEHDGRMLVLRTPGNPIAARTVIWTGGIRISDLIRDSGLHTGMQGRVHVDAFLQVEGHPGVFAIGDNALAHNPATGVTVPTAAQFALQQGYLTATNLFRLVQRRPLRPYRPYVLGEVVSLGRHLAIGWMALPLAGRVRFFGFLASLLKRAIAERHLLLLWRERRMWWGG